jgi:pyruvate carboxylase subunit B
VKYFVDVNGETVEVAVDAEHAWAVDAGYAGVAPEGGANPGPGAVLDPGADAPVRVLRVGAAVHRVEVRRLGGRGRYALFIDGFRYDVEALDERARAIRDITAATAGPLGPAPLVAPMPGLIVRVNVAPGDVVQAGQGLVVMEAMKMENELRTQAGGTVKAVLVQPGATVEKGARLVELE